jgi:hypothetical protein
MVRCIDIRLVPSALCRIQCLAGTLTMAPPTAPDAITVVHIPRHCCVGVGPGAALVLLGMSMKRLLLAPRAMSTDSHSAKDARFQSWMTVR